MRVISQTSGALLLLTMSAVSVSGSVSAQQQDTPAPSIIVNGTRPPEVPAMTDGPEIKGVISARNGDKMKVTTADGTGAIIAINDATRIKASGGLFSGNRDRLAADSLLNGLPVTVKTLQSTGGLVASQISFRNSDLKTATMIRNGTSQRFDEQTAATEALRGRMGAVSYTHLTLPTIYSV